MNKTSAAQSAIQKKAIDVDKLLAKLYGFKKQTRKSDPTSELILTVLSQNTNDLNRDRAYQALRTRFPSWSDVASAKASAIAKEIKVGGLAKIKSKRIKKILSEIGKQSQDYSLTALNTMTDQQIWEYLLSFDGVGPKTASCVLLFSLGRRAMPVDTHVYRVGRRLGFIPEKLSVEKAHSLFLDLSLPVDMYQFHLNLIQLGRNLCRPRKPKCEACPLTRYCLYYQTMMIAGREAAPGSG